MVLNFKNNELLKKALTHRSWVNENKDNKGTNERMEFCINNELPGIAGNYKITFINEEKQTVNEKPVFA